MNQVILTDNNGVVIGYELDSIAHIRHGKAKDLYSKSDLAANGLLPMESLLQIVFKDGKIASFPSTWTMTFTL